MLKIVASLYFYFFSYRFGRIDTFVFLSYPEFIPKAVYDRRSKVPKNKVMKEEFLCSIIISGVLYLLLLISYCLYFQKQISFFVQLYFVDIIAYFVLGNILYF